MHNDVHNRYPSFCNIIAKKIERKKIEKFKMNPSRSSPSKGESSRGKTYVQIFVFSNRKQLKLNFSIKLEYILAPTSVKYILLLQFSV